VTTTSTDGIVKRNERETVLDRHMATRKNLEGSAAWLQIEMAGSSVIPDLDSMNVSGSLLSIVFEFSIGTYPFAVLKTVRIGKNWEQPAVMDYRGILQPANGEGFLRRTCEFSVVLLSSTHLHIINFTGFM